MPELPEVETAARRIEPLLLGRKITAWKLRWKKTLACPTQRTFTRRVIGARFREVGRRGKYLDLTLRSKDGALLHLLIHLRMSGKLETCSSSQPLDKHDHFLLQLDNHTDFRFNDTRKFGRVYLVEDPNQITHRLGLEPLSDEFSAGWLCSALENRTGAIKPLLIGQTLVAGLGNIYVDESLWGAKIHPTTPAKQIPENQIRTLRHTIRRVLRRAIDNMGTDMGDGVVTYGAFNPVAYGRAGKPCKRCKTEIERIVVGQRGTHYCPKCQMP